MTARIFTCTPAWECDDLAEAVGLVRAGGVLVVPTDTVYGIGADARNPEAVMKVLAAKGRGRRMPPPVLVAGVEAIDSLCVDVSDAARRLASNFWPGGLTLILTVRPDLGWDLGDTGGTIALRMPDCAPTLSLLRAASPLAVTSANLTGEPPATDIDAARAAFGERIAGYVDAGPTPGATPSTILDLAHGECRAIRLGAISLEELSASAGCDIVSAN